MLRSNGNSPGSPRSQSSNILKYCLVNPPVAEYCDECVCLSVCLFAAPPAYSEESHVQTSPNFPRMSLMLMCASDGAAIQHVDCSISPAI